MPTPNLDFASLYPQTQVSHKDIDAVKSLLQERINHKKMLERLNKIDNLLENSK